MSTKQIQLLLTYLGYDPGPLDGALGLKTKAAVYDFQRDFGGLTVDGLPGEETQKALRHAVTYGMPDKPNTSGTPPDASGAEAYLHSDGYYHIPRGVNVQLSRNLWSYEVMCQGKGCCTESIISKRMVDTFQAIRDDYGEPIEITSADGSGYRCAKHNSDVGGSTKSLHLTGSAFDLHCKDVARLLPIVEKHITDGEIGTYSWGIHAGVWSRGYVNRFTK